MDYKVSPNYIRFIALCLKAYESVREDIKLWTTLFKFMVPSGMPELSNLEDIDYMLQMLREGETPGEAAAALADEIDKSITTKWRRFDNMIHTWIHETE